VIASQENVIFVAGSKWFLWISPELHADSKSLDYRLGAFGWLAGQTMQDQGLPNAGLSDQRLLFQWVQTYISQVGGDSTSVSAWGESAGASSILHHLIARNSTTGDLQASYFSKVALQSPAFEWQWLVSSFKFHKMAMLTKPLWRDLQSLENIYQSFAKLAKCTNCSVSELQKLDYKNLSQANLELYQGPSGFPCTGLFPIGPSIDSTVIKQLPPVALNGIQGGTFDIYPFPGNHHHEVAVNLY